MNNKCRLPLLIALTITLAACGEDKEHNFTGMGDNGGSLPNGGSDSVNPNDVAGGIPPNQRGNFNPNDADYQTLAIPEPLRYVFCPDCGERVDAW